mmetsp:Transcript_5359/g.12806  ORF Transcript_5359/g.12806 Transcript_5359/m.12806 type:complete len:423 (+) Transcript_5359:58-1326(+)
MVDRLPVVIDCGTGYTKMGYGGNDRPQWTIPTYIATNADKAKGVKGIGVSKGSMADMDFFIGDEAFRLRDSERYLCSSPIEKGQIQSWDDMERYWHHCMYKYLRCDPEEHNVLLTEPPMNSPDNREQTAEIMFETFNVAGLHIGVQAVLALYGHLYGLDPSMAASMPALTGTVLDAGDGVTHIVPVADGFVIGSCIKEIPLAGKDVTQFIVDMLRDRQEPIPPECRLEAATTIKEKHAYIAKDLVKEFKKYDENSSKIKILEGNKPRSQEKWSIEIGHERFLAPEIFFNPEIFSERVSTPLPNLVDQCIQSSPIDYRRKLYENVVLSGGSTMFERFPERLQRDIKGIVDMRLQRAFDKSGSKPSDISVKVSSSSKQRYAVWFGGSVFSMGPLFKHVLHTKAQYEEIGPNIARSNALSAALGA